MLEEKIKQWIMDLFLRASFSLYNLWQLGDEENAINSTCEVKDNKSN